MIKKHIGIVYPAGKARLSEEQKQAQVQKFEQQGFLVTEIRPEWPSPDGCTSSPVLERASQLAYALTARKFHIVMAARGGVGTTELVPFLENMLPPVLSDKTFVGFSDNSFLGCYLALRYPNMRYIHGQMAFPSLPHQENDLDRSRLLDLLQDRDVEDSFTAPVVCSKLSALYDIEMKKISLTGTCIPLNLSLAESVSSVPFLKFPEKSILFLEDCHEHFYRIVRKCDSLINSGLLDSVQAIVLGDFSDCLGADEKPLDRSALLNWFAEKTGLPVFDLPIFGHGNRRFPLIMGSAVTLDVSWSQVQDKLLCGTSCVTLSWKSSQKASDRLATTFPIGLFKQQLQPDSTVHMTGIGGTGMAQVAGLFVASGQKVTGSDQPIYPPMDKLIADLGIKPDVGFLAANIEKHRPQAIVMANVVSRLSASLKKNEELEFILNQRIPMMSFPSALRKYFLHSSQNIVVSGTHGKTTTSSLVAFLLSELNQSPSYLIGGSPVNFKSGFALHSKDLFVLEGDEYDSAFFDKGPKFLHYEPKIALMANIEFDHADIYENVEAIEQEFLRLAKLCRDRNGIVVANLDDARVAKVVKNSNACVIGFSAQADKKHEFGSWVLQHFKTQSDGIVVTVKAPTNQVFEFKAGVFGAHNALNCVSAFATLHAFYIQRTNQTQDLSFVEQAIQAISRFKGVKRRFELLQNKNDICVFDDFAHHPTAIVATLAAFQDYMKSSGRSGRLIVCFDPRNATMRRNVMQQELSQSFHAADLVLLGKVPQDLRMDQNQALDGLEVAKSCGKKAHYFDDNQLLLQALKQEVKAGDTVVFMSSGSFDGISHQFAKSL